MFGWLSSKCLYVYGVLLCCAIDLRHLAKTHTANPKSFPLPKLSCLLGSCQFAPEPPPEKGARLSHSHTMPTRDNPVPSSTYAPTAVGDRLLRLCGNDFYRDSSHIRLRACDTRSRRDSSKKGGGGRGGVFFPSHPPRNREDSQVYRNGQQSIQPQPSPKHAPLNNEVNICQSSLLPLPWRTRVLPHPNVLKYIQNMSCPICFTQRQPKAPCTLACLQAHVPMSLASWCASHVHARTHTHDCSRLSDPAQTVCFSDLH